MEFIYPDSLPRPRGHYSPAVIHNKTIYVSGQLPIDENGVPQVENFEMQVRQTMKNIQTILEASGSSLQQIVKVNVFIDDMSNWPKFNEIYAAIMGDHRPARIVIPVKTFNYGCNIEMDCIAAID